MASADFEVVRIVRGCDLEASRAELPVHVLVGDDGNDASLQRKANALPESGAIAFVFGMDGDGDVPEHRLGPCGRDRQVGELTRGLDQRIANVPEMAGLAAVPRVDLVVGERGAIDRTPVHDALSSIEESAIEERLEDRAHGSREAFVHGEARPPPVAGAAHLLELIQNDAAVLLSPLPDLLDELLAPEARGSRFLERRGACAPRSASKCRHDRFPGTQSASKPSILLKRIEHVLDGVVERVTHVKPSGHVRRRNHDDEGLFRRFRGRAGTTLRVEHARERTPVDPLPIDALLGGLEVETLRDFHVSACCRKARRPCKTGGVSAARPASRSSRASERGFRRSSQPELAR